MLPYLDPALPLVWRAPGVLQIGLDPEHAVALADVDPDAPSALRLLTGHTLREHLLADRLGPPLGPALRPVLELLEQAGLVSAGAPAEAWEHAWVHVSGDGALARSLADRLAVAGIGRTSLEADRPDGRPDLVVVAPDRGRGLDAGDALVAGQVPHLWVHGRDGRAVVGPLVLPGETGCLRCQDLHRADADAAWPRLAFDWEQARAAASPGVVDLVAALAARQVLAWLAGRDAACVGATLEEQPDGSLRRLTWPPHPGCGCCWHTDAVGGHPGPT